MDTSLSQTLGTSLKCFCLGELTVLTFYGTIYLFIIMCMVHSVVLNVVVFYFKLTVCLDTAVWSPMRVAKGFCVTRDCPKISSVTRDGAKISRVKRDWTSQHDA